MTCVEHGVDAYDRTRYTRSWRPGLETVRRPMAFLVAAFKHDYISLVELIDTG